MLVTQHLLLLCVRKWGTRRRDSHGHPLSFLCLVGLPNNGGSLSLAGPESQSLITGASVQSRDLTMPMGTEGR